MTTSRTTGTPPAGIEPPHPHTPAGGVSAATRSRGSTRVLDRVLVALAFGAALFPGLLQVLGGPEDHDIAWYLYVAGRVLDGARLYVDVIEVNPPLIVALSIPAVLLSRVTGGPEILLFELFVVALIGVSLALCATVLRRLVPTGEVLPRRLFLALVLFATFALPASSNVFGQREHIMLVLVLPYLFAAAARSMRLPLPRGLALAAGVLAGIGVSLKPFFVVPWLLVEVYLAWRSGPRRAWLRPEGLAVAGVLAAYALAVVALTPAYFAVVTLARETYRDFIAVSYTYILLSKRTLLAVVAGLAVLVYRSERWNRELGRVLALGTLGFIGSVLLQRKGWVYHFYPVVASTTLLLGLLLWTALRRENASARLVALVVPVGGLAVMTYLVAGQVSSILHPRPHSEYMRDLTPPMTRLMRTEAAGESVFALSSLPFPMFPAVNYAGVRWAGRFPCLWPLSGVYAPQRGSGLPLRYNRPGAMGHAETYTFNTVIGDLLRDPPRLLFVFTADPADPDPPLPHPDFDYLVYFSQDGRFARMMEGYRLRGRIGGYRVFERMPERAR